MNINRKYIFPIISAIGIVIAIFYVSIASRPRPVGKPIDLPPEAPFSSYISGAGLIEANTENISIGTSIPGIVSEIYVKVGGHVKKGDPLFKIDDRDTIAALEYAEASLNEAESSYADAEDQLKEIESIKDKRARSLDELKRKKYAALLAEAKVKTAKANVFVAQTTLNRLLVTAPVEGDILSLNVRLGEYAPSGVLADPLIIFGNIDPMNIRINIDENDAWRFKLDAPAYAYLRGNRDFKTPLKFVRVEPYVIPKQSLTGNSTERVDTRVLQVIYSYDRKNLPAYTGQQVDVYIKANPLSSDSPQLKK